MELNILDWFQTLHTPILDKIMTSITKLGDAGIFWIILTLLFLIIPKMRKTRNHYGSSTDHGSADLQCSSKKSGSKNKTIRCKHQYTAVGGKASRLFIPIGTYGRIFCFGYCVISRRRKKLWKPALVLACLIAVSRLYLYVHYPTDVLGGMVFGILAGFAGYWIVKLLETKLSGRKNAGNQIRR